MAKLLLFVLAFCMAGCAGQTGKDGVKQDPATQADSAYAWTKLMDSAAWKKSYNFQMFSIRDSLWVFHPDGTWFSADGLRWTRSPLTNVINNLAFLNYVQFKNAIYGLGHLEGNIEQFSFTPAIYRTTDLRKWDTLTTTSNLPGRFFYHPFVFDDKIWIIGGEDKAMEYADIWNSADALHWVKQKDSLPFGKRKHSQVVNLNDTLYLLNNDVWVSTNGLNWTIRSTEIVQGVQLMGFSAQVLDNRIWLLGCNRNREFTSEILSSSDGINWTAHHAPWSPRGGIASAVHKRKIYMTGGKYGGFAQNGTTTAFIYSNDLWAFGKQE